MPTNISINLDRDELSERIGGGIPKSSIFVIEGPDGGGKSIIAQRLAYGFLKNQTKVTFISTELSTMDFVDQMKSIDYDITQNILNEELLFIPMFPTLGKVRLKSNFITNLITNKRIYDNDVIIFDTLSYLIIHDKLRREDIFMIVKFFKKLTALGKILVINVDPNLVTDEFLKIIRNVSDIYLSVEAKSVLGNILRVVSINRFRASESDVTVQFPFSVKPGAGLSIEIASLS